MSEVEEWRSSLMANVVDTALRLWGHTFHGITTSRRENLLKVSDPKFVSLLSESHRFKPRQCGSLFGRTFIKGMVKEAREDQQLRIISRSNGPPSVSRNRGAGYSSFNRGSSYGFHRGSGSRAVFNSSFNKGATRGGAFNLNRLETGARLGYFEVFWSSLSKDPWVMSSIREGVKIDFSSIPFQTIAGSNMPMGKDQTEVCDREIMALLEKKAIEPVEASAEGFVSGLFVIPKRSGAHITQGSPSDVRQMSGSDVEYIFFISSGQPDIRFGCPMDWAQGSNGRGRSI
ncbi:hypothetical protein OUZ56_003143 [Daphnia magna]|uniref:Uncharacterized protein n=1 Tax=Daphnia magna TaxID=35525 RepID=A0ABR0A857_9CRUS|nr:hypothetical protein OUZ56_003143 [Daphnia magna]